jgi:hypothetical protein
MNRNEADVTTATAPSQAVLTAGDRCDLAELLAVLACVVGAEEQLPARLKLHAEVGLGTAAVAAVASREDGLGGCGGSGHVSLISVHRCLAQRSQWDKDSLLLFQLRELIKSITSHPAP